MPARQRVRNIGAALGLPTLAACSAPAPQAAPPVAAAPSFDGRYVGTVRATGAAGNMRPADCATDPGVTIVVANNRFTMAVPHPHAAAATPSLADRTTPVYQASIAADGTITGTSNTNATIKGSVISNRMNGEIFGLLCYYAFSADRK